MMDQFANYGHALIALSLYGVMGQVLNAMTGIRKGNEGMVPGQTYSADFENAGYRLERTYMNSSEVLVFTGFIIVAAILAGAAPFWVNLLACVILIMRVFANAMHLRGSGGLYGGLRTMMAIGTMLANVALVALTLWAVFL